MTLGGTLRSARAEIRCLLAQVRGVSTPADPNALMGTHNDSVRAALVAIDAAIPVADELQALPRRGDVGLAEATRDPVFLLQSRRIYLAELPGDFEWDSDLERVRGTELVPGGAKRHRVMYSMVDFAKGYPDSVIETWDPVGVWFTRTEAEAWGSSHAYRFDQGWRVYCLCAEGEMATLLRARSTKPTGVMEPAAEALPS